jgi:argininosuccinate lyase
VQAGQLAQDIHAQYAEPTPWFVLVPGELTGVSSIMPQKRNPAALEQLRAQASLLLGEMHSVSLLAHNTRTGMFDYRMYDPVPSARALQVFTLFRQVVEGIVVDKARALEEVKADYSTTTEIADGLMQRADVPFRTGHHFASELTDYGRGRGLKLHEIPHAEAARIYQAQTGQAFPLGAAEFAQVISAEYMVFGRKGTGGPQPAEVNRMLAAERERLNAERAWLKARNADLARADAARERAFSTLAQQ